MGNTVILAQKNLSDDEKKALGKERAARMRMVRKQILGMTQEEFCHNSNIPMQTYASWETVRFKGISEEGIDRCLARYKDLGLMCTKQWLMYGIGVAPSLMQDLQEPLADKHTDYLEEIAQELYVFMQHGNGVDAYVENQAMAPIYEKGDTVAGYIESLEEALGQNCIVVYQSHGEHKKMIRKVSKDQQWLVLSAHHADYPPIVIAQEQLELIAPVLWHRRVSLSYKKKNGLS